MSDTLIVRDPLYDGTGDEEESNKELPKPSPPLPLRLNNPYARSAKTIVIWLRISTDLDNYLFRHVLAGEYGAKVNIAATLFNHLHQYCLTIGLPPVWNIDEKNPERIARILSRTNFEDISELKARLEIQADTICELQSANTKLHNDIQSLRQRRANPGPTKPKTKSAPCNRKPRGTGSRRTNLPKNSSATAGTEGRSDGQAEGQAESHPS